MRRPLALFGLAWLAAHLVYALFPQQLPVAALITVTAAAFAAAAVLAKRHSVWAWRSADILLAVSLALCCQTVWRSGPLSSSQALEGSAMPVRAVVHRTYTVSEGEYAKTDLDLLAAGGQIFSPALSVQVSSMQVFAAGDIVEGTLFFSQADSADQSRGIQLRAAARTAFVKTGVSAAPVYLFVRVQRALSLNLRSLFTREIGGVAAAVGVGDRTGLTQEIRTAYRRAGISHLLVVSGLHMTVLAGAADLLLRRVRRQLRAAVLSALILAFMALTGFTPSVVRAGIMALFVAVGGCLAESADPLTSLGAAVILITAQNPFAALDIGLLLSCSATLGIIAANMLLSTGAEGREERSPALHRTASLLLPPCFAAMATLPVLIAAGGGVSLVSVPVNLAAVPLLTPLLVLDLIAALTAFSPILTVICQPAALLCGLLIRLLSGLASLAASLPFGLVTLDGFYAMVCVLSAFVLFCLVLRARGLKARAVRAACTAVFVLAASFAGAELSRGTIRVALAGSGAQPAVVAVRDGEAAVIWRSGQTDPDSVRYALERLNVRAVAFVADCTETGAASAFIEETSPARVCSVTEYSAGAVFSLLPDVQLSLRRQGDGSLCLIEAAGITLLASVGKTDLTGYGPADYFLAGTQQPASLSAGTILCSDRAADWVGDSGLPVASGELPVVWIRPGGAVKLMGGAEWH